MIKRYKYSVLVSAVICYLSLKSSSDLDALSLFEFPNADKLIHLCMYFGLMATLIFETFITGIKKYSIYILATIPFFLGILMEVLQKTLTATRSASIYDIIFNALGIALAVAGWAIIKNFYNPV